MNLEQFRPWIDEIHKQNTNKVLALLRTDYDLRNLDSVINPDTAKVYQTVLPKYAKLCELDQLSGLDSTQRAELAVCYASLYYTFGDSGIEKVAAMWIETRPLRLARNN